MRFPFFHPARIKPAFISPHFTHLQYTILVHESQVCTYEVYNTFPRKGSECAVKYDANDIPDRLTVTRISEQVKDEK
jgi:hypothetical protein